MEVDQLNKFLSTWERKVYKLICQIPSGHVATYGSIANKLDPKSSALAVSNLRRKLYHTLTHDTDVPLHRLGSQDDDHCSNDSKETREISIKKRLEEGFYDKPRYW